MTCIVGFKQKGKVYIGGDSAGVADYNLVIRADEKVFANGEMIYGFTSSFRMGQILRYGLDVPKQSKNQNDMRFMCTTFIDAAIGALEDKGFAKNVSGEKEGGDFMVGYKGELYRIYSDFQVELLHDNYNAVGCGANFALGAFHAFLEYEATPDERIHMALDAATHHSSGVCPPYTILSI